MASPSLSGSVARYKISAFFIIDFNCEITFVLSFEGTYVAENPLSTSTPRSLLGRSLTWPTDASIAYSSPKKRFKVLALDGDSTIIKLLDFCPICRNLHHFYSNNQNRKLIF